MSARPHWAWILGSIALLGAPPPTGAGETREKPARAQDVPLGVNLIVNGGLEAPCPTLPPPDKKHFWDPKKRTTGYYRWPPGFTFYDRWKSGPVEIDEAVSLQGKRSFRLSPVLFGNNGFYIAANVRVPVAEGDTFNLSVYVRNRGKFPAYRSLGIQFRMADGKARTVAGHPPRHLDAADKWTRIDLTGDAPKGARWIDRVSFSTSNTPMAGACWWDAMSLVKLRSGKTAEPEVK